MYIGVFLSKGVFMSVKVKLQDDSVGIWKTKYQLKDQHGNPLESTIQESFRRIAKALAKAEKEEDRQYWEDEFYQAMLDGATPAGRIMSNAGAEEYKPATSLINCTVSDIVEDSMYGIMYSALEAGQTLAAGCGIGYEFSTLRPKGSFVTGAGAETSGAVSFMDIFDSMCFTVASSGGRRGAQMATFAVWHPDVEAFITAKRTNGRLRQFNMSLLIDDLFMEAVKNNTTYDLIFPARYKEITLGMCKREDLVPRNRFWDIEYCKKMGYILSDDEQTIYCKVHKTVNAKELWDKVMASTYDFAEPGFLLVDKINKYNNNWFVENIRATNPCGEQPLPRNGACLLGSINVTSFVNDPFKNPSFDWEKYRKTVRVFTRLLDNVVEFNGLPLQSQRDEITYKRRHGMGILGLGSALTLMNMRYGSDESLAFTEELMKVMAIEGFKYGIELAKEKGPAPIFNDCTNGVSNKVLWTQSPYMERIWEVDPELKKEALEHGCRFTHHTSIAPTGTISFSVNNNASNGIEPTFSFFYTRNVIVSGKKTKKAMKVYSYELLLYKEIFGNDNIPEGWSDTGNISPLDHVKIQAVAQKWVDSAISKTINVPTDLPFEEFKDIYIKAYDLGLKGCTTFRFNPDAFQGVLVKDSDLQSTEYVFHLEDGTVIRAKGDDIVDYDGEEHTAQNLYDAIKEGYYGRF